MASDKKDCTSMEEVQVLKYGIKFVLGNKGMKKWKRKKRCIRNFDNEESDLIIYIVCCNLNKLTILLSENVIQKFVSACPKLY